MNWREMRTAERKLSREENENFIQQNCIGHLGTCGVNGNPYVIPMNYAYRNGRFILHCAKQGKKLNNINTNNKVCFEITRHDGTKKSGKSCSAWQVNYQSVIVFGRTTIPPDNEKRELLEEFTGHYTTDGVSLSDEGIDKTCVIILEVDHMTGKRS